MATPESPTAQLIERWPRRPWVHRTPAVPVPVVDLGGREFDEWFATKSSKFRQETRRTRRRIEDEGATFVLADAAGAARGIDAFIDLHGARREGMGGSNALITGLREMLLAAAAKLIPADRMRIYTIEVEGRPVAANILVAAGHEVSGWNSGFDEEWARYSPSMLLTLQALADAAGKGERRMSLGPGAGGYKRRLADHEEQVVTATMVPRGGPYPLTRMRLVPYQARWAISARTSEETKQRMRRLRGRVG
jgi:CelD/BcsL family acetyltransferase involved in cellulose biosynthesis